ncbi:MAG: hypothetical protein NTX42_09650 [Methanothrix sp.]|nr:hypothetical protein [Methanothrix sp.]
METHVSPLSTGTGKAMEEARPSIVKFQMSVKEAGNHYKSWVEKEKHLQDDFDIDSSLEKIKGCWVPVWLFEVSAESAWHGEVSHEEPYTDWETKSGPGVYESKQVAVTKYRTVWESVSGNHYDNYLVPVSTSGEITQNEIEALKFRQLDFKSYDESYLEGLQVLATDLSKMGAKDTCNRRINELETQACKYEVERLRGCSTKVTYNTSTFALLPMFVLSYSHKDRIYRNLINGVTCEIYGDEPPINKMKKYVSKTVEIIKWVIILFGGLFLIGLLKSAIGQG